jgi:hypothetical protein
MAGVSPCRKRGQEVAKYRVLVGLDYPPNKRAEAGDEVSDLPSSSITWLLADGLIEAVEGTSKSSKKTVVAPKPEPEPEPEPVEETVEVIAEESVEEVDE